MQRNVAPSKKAKTTAKTSTSGSGKEPEFVLDKNRLVRVRSFKGKTYVDIRVYYEKDGELLPGKQGISLTTQQWRKLLDSAEDINKAVADN